MKKEWFRLDTAALIFPAIMNKKWSNVFRLSALLKEDVDPGLLQQAVNDLQKRFPTFYVSLHRGFFWNYLEEVDFEVKVQPDYAYPLTFMSQSELKNHCLRVFWFKNRLAVEFFHSLSDGSGAKVYFCTLLSRYLQLRYSIEPQYNDNVLNINDEVNDYELEDSFHKNACAVEAPRKEEPSYHLHGTPLDEQFHILTTGIVKTDGLLSLAHQYHCTVTAFLSAVMIQCLLEMQDQEKPRARQNPVKITIPVNMRKLFGSKTLRNFVLTLNLGIDPRKGDYTLAEICSAMSHQIAFSATKQNMSSAIASNVNPQRNIIIKLAPLFIKHLVMSSVYSETGESGGSINISNLGNINLGQQYNDYIQRIEFIIGVQKSYPNNCSVASYNNVTCINMIRTIEQSTLEQLFFSKLVELGIPVEIECNRR